MVRICMPHLYNFIIFSNPLLPLELQSCLQVAQLIECAILELLIRNISVPQDLMNLCPKAR